LLAQRGLLDCPDHDVAGEREPSPRQYELQIVCLGLQRLAGSPLGAEKVGTKDTSTAWVIRLKGSSEAAAGETAATGVMSRLASKLAGTDA
jgi:hypothetical protein